MSPGTRVEASIMLTTVLSSPKKESTTEGTARRSSTEKNITKDRDLGPTVNSVVALCSLVVYTQTFRATQDGLEHGSPRI